ncbi:hypothetical protein NDU88_011716 [Pleurodeles waltl]|uniref:Uncharacterized protein n=1 Tax=Pleurodeles waltl TaxID=8319 RepID=A0AAV7R2H1_PLEWA|nr:hypothetical protein NDU88_011716 [Pleurodeles waltl]
MDVDRVLLGVRTSQPAQNGRLGWTAGVVQPQRRSDLTEVTEPPATVKAAYTPSRVREPGLPEQGHDISTGERDSWSQGRQPGSSLGLIAGKGEEPLRYRSKAPSAEILSE